MDDLISRQALCEYALNQKDKSVNPNDIMRFPSVQLAKLDIWNDGTLCISVSKGQLDKIGRVLVEEDGSTFCKLFYQDAQPERKKGTWTDDASCPFCGFQPWYERDIHTLSFCPNCGADMRGGHDETD